MKTIILTCAAALTTLIAVPAGAVSGGGFSVSIQNRADDGSGYVRMRHGQVYSVCFSNNLDRRSDAEMSIDGLSMGTWRLRPHQSACIERPATERGRFTFYRADSAEGQAVGSSFVSRGDKGKLSVSFYPEIERNLVHQPFAREPSMAGDSLQFGQKSTSGVAEGYAGPQANKRTAPAYDEDLSAGVTGLTGRSKQRFRTAGQIERDYDRMVTLELRLVHSSAYDPVPAEPRPLPGRYSRYAPPPVGQ